MQKTSTESDPDTSTSKAFKALDVSKGSASLGVSHSHTRWAKRPMIKDTECLGRQDGDRFRYLLQPFLSYAFVCIYLEQRGHKSKKQNKTKERQNKTQNEDEVQLSEHIYLSQRPHGNPFLGDSAQVHKWHAGQVWINSKLSSCCSRLLSEQKQRELSLKDERQTRTSLVL